MFKLKTFFSSIMSIEPIRRQSIVSLIWQITFTFIGFFSTIYFAHTIGASVLGAYFLFLAYYGIIDMFSDGGLGGAAIKRISEGEEQDRYFSAYFVLRSLFMIVVVVILLIFRDYFVDLEEAGLFNWLFLVLMASHLYGTLSTGVAGRGKMGIRATTSFIDNVTRVIIQVISVYLGFRAVGMVGGFVGGMLIASLIESRFFDLHFVRFRWRHIKRLATFSFWLFLTGSGMLVFSYADVVLIGYYLKTADVGVYKVAMQFASFALFIPAALRGTLWPKISRWGKTGELELIEESLARACAYSLILAIPIFAGGVLLGDKLLYFFYGDEFAWGYLTLVVILILQLVNIFQVFYNMYLGALDRQKDAFKVTFVAVIANVVLNLILIPKMGIAGAAVASLMTMVLNSFLARNVLSEVIRIRFKYQIFSNILKASFVMSLFVGGYRVLIPLSNVWLTILPVIFGGIVYGILLLKLDMEICDELKAIFIHMNGQK